MQIILITYRVSGKLFVLFVLSHKTYNFQKKVREIIFVYVIQFILRFKRLRIALVIEIFLTE